MRIQGEGYKDMGLPGKPPGSPICFYRVGISLGNSYKNRVVGVGDRLGDIADKDIKEDIP